jgi:hypothetical protein
MLFPIQKSGPTPRFSKVMNMLFFGLLAMFFKKDSALVRTHACAGEFLSYENSKGWNYRMIITGAETNLASLLFATIRYHPFPTRAPVQSFRSHRSEAFAFDAKWLTRFPVTLYIVISKGAATGPQIDPRRSRALLQSKHVST